MKKMVVFAMVLVLGTTAAQVLAGGVATGVKIGTLGIGADVTVGLHERLNLRVNGNYLNFGYDDTIDDIDFELDLDFKSAIGMLDWHPFANGFRISAGAIYNGNQIELTATPTEPEKIGDNEYPPELIGDLEGELEFENVAPYVGIGFGHAVGENQRLSFIFDLGVIFQSYEVSLDATGPAAQLPQFQQDLQREEDDIQEDLDGFKIYPVLSFGIAYKF
jgi:hypothetical protein